MSSVFHIANCIFMGLVLSISGVVSPALSEEHKRIGILVDGPYWYNTPLFDRIKKELDRVNDGQFEIEYPDQLSLNGQYDLEKIQAYVDQLLQREDLDAFIAPGMVSSYLFSEKKTSVGTRGGHGLYIARRVRNDIF